MKSELLQEVALGHLRSMTRGDIEGVTFKPHKLYEKGCEGPCDICDLIDRIVTHENTRRVNGKPETAVRYLADGGYSLGRYLNYDYRPELFADGLDFQAKMPILDGALSEEELERFIKYVCDAGRHVRLFGFDYSFKEMILELSLGYCEANQVDMDEVIVGIHKDIVTIIMSIDSSSIVAPEVYAEAYFRGLLES